ncbi:MAG: hypothetical protein HY315_10925 [Acidobacteria bacterium]|nr:hypothetical protein [Acidobacteriota bacterium]
MPGHLEETKEAILAQDPLLARSGPTGRTAVPPTVLAVDVEKIVIYVADVAFDRFTTTPAPTEVQPRAFASNVGLGDIVAVNGKPARGTWFLRASTVLSTPNPGPTTGIAIADTERLAIVDQIFEIQQADGKEVGTIVSYGPGFGPQPVGAPAAQRLSNLAVIGGTGAYLGVRGQLGTTGFGPDKPPIRFASASEIPALRRVFGGGTLNFVVHLIPATAPEVVELANDRPAVFHASDHVLVTAANPASPGEVLSMLARGLGPTRPGVDPGNPFPREPLNLVNSPVEILVDGTPAQVVFAGGEPGSVNVYSVDFRLPTSTKSGRSTLQIRAGHMNGLEFSIPVR